MLSRFYFSGVVLLLFLSLSLQAEERSFKAQNYFIKKDYIARTDYSHYDDRWRKDDCQDEVYALAHSVATENSFTRITDIGCGSAFKLIKYFDMFDTEGYEIEPTLSYLKERYPTRSWEFSDLSSTPVVLETDIIVCADVVEHLVDPDQLLKFINRFDFKFLIISTPDRDQLLKYQNNRQSQSGPPVNPHHIREWGHREFEQYISQFFNIVSHINTKKEYWGQVIVATKK